MNLPGYPPGRLHGRPRARMCQVLLRYMCVSVCVCVCVCVYVWIDELIILCLSVCLCMAGL